MELIDKETIRKEIELLKDTACRRADNRYGREDANTYEAWAGAYEKVLEILDTLPEQPECHTVEEWMQHIKNADPLTKDIFSKGPYNVLYDALNHPYQHCYDAIKEFGELCFQTGAKSIKPEQPVLPGIDEEMDKYYDSPEWEGQTVSWMTFANIARHFAEWGAEHLKR